MKKRFGPPRAVDLAFHFEAPAFEPEARRPARHPIVYVLALGLVVEVLVTVAASVALIADAGGLSASPLAVHAGRYLGAVARGDAAGAWALAEVDPAALPGGVLQLDDEKALAALLADPAARNREPRNLRLLASRPRGSDTEADFRFGEAVGQRMTLTLRRAEGGGWKVVLRPGLISLALPAPAAVRMDGRDLPTGFADGLAVLPGRHRFASGDGRLLESRTFVGEVLPDGRQTLTLDLPFTTSAIESFHAVVASALEACAIATAPAPAGCPQAATVAGPVEWRLVGDGTRSATLAWSREKGYAASGRFQYLAAYRVHVPEGIAHIAATGGYRMPLRWSGDAFTLGDGGVHTTAGLAAQRPAVEDAVLRAAVGAGLAACAGSTLLRPPDCPNTLPSSGYVTPVSWRMVGDGSAQAGVAFDPLQGTFVVTGSYEMTAAYTEAGRAKTGSSSGAFRADLLWDGSKPVLVGIRGPVV